MSAPKRPRLSGSFSPASPPYHLAKGVEQAKPAIYQQPNTPTSPPPQSMSSLPTNVSTGSTANTQLWETTPASTAGTASHIAKDGDGDTLMSDELADVAMKDAESSGSRRSDHMRTDHDRIQDGLKLVGEQDRLRDYLLDVNVGPKYKLCEKPLSPSAPHPSQNLITVYGLTGIYKTVERFDPVTGAKINKLRRSYENQIKTLGIAGRNKARETPGELSSLMAWPEEDYHNKRVHGKAIENCLSDQFAAKLGRALSIPLPQQKLTSEENERWKSLIGTEEPAKTTRPVPQEGQPRIPLPNGVVKAPGAGTRPERAGKKRRYNDSSFTGYGEGYLDDDREDSDDDKAMAARRKRPKA